MNTDNILIIRIGEGIGNQLFQYAYARALKEKGVNVYLDLNKTFDNYFRKYRSHEIRHNNIQNFNITIPQIDVIEYSKYNYIKRDNTKNRIIYILARYGLWKYKIYDEDMVIHIKNPTALKKNYYVRCWFQDEFYFKHIRNILLKELTPKKKIHISDELKRALNCRESVSLHIRRGDYVKLHQDLKLEYYKRAIELIKSKYNNPKFLIFSDDLEWVEKKLKIKGDLFYVNQNKELMDYEELLIMSRCKSNIISNSTFSWWGAWLNRNPEKVIVAPRNGWIEKQKNIIPKEWNIL